MKRLLIFWGCLIFGLVLGCSLGWLWMSGAFTLWQPIDYFPYPVQKILAMDQFGGEFWVETKNNEIYQITHACPEKSICWTKVENVPSDISAPYFGEFDAGYNKCGISNFVFPFQKITMCITSIYFVAPEASASAYLALTENGKLWIQYKDAADPFMLLIRLIIYTCVGGIIGIALGIFLIRKRR